MFSESKSKFLLKTKIYNHLLENGSKEVCEKIFLKTLKKLQKTSKKNSKQVVLTAILLSAPTFKIFTFRRKKKKKVSKREVPYFIQNRKVQISFTIKLMLKVISKKGSTTFESLKDELLLGAKNASKTLPIRKLLNEFIVSKKTLLTYYKW